MSGIWVLLIIYTSLLLILRSFKVHYAVSLSLTELWRSLMVAMHHCRIWSTISQHAHICSAYVLVTWHIHPTLWHLWFDPPTSQAGWVFVYETSLIETRYNTFPSTLPDRISTKLSSMYSVGLCKQIWQGCIFTRSTYSSSSPPNADLSRCFR